MIKHDSDVPISGIRGFIRPDFGIKGARNNNRIAPESLSYGTTTWPKFAFDGVLVNLKKHATLMPEFNAKTQP